MVTLLTDEIPSPIGGIILVTLSEGSEADAAPPLCAVEFDDCLDRLQRNLTARFGRYELLKVKNSGGHSDKMMAYLEGDVTAIDALPVDSGGTEFQQQVWNALRHIPAGQTWQYGEMAKKLGRPDAPRAVGAANGRNPLSIVVPCHRLIGSTGKLTGYAGGLKRKAWLLAHEGALAANS
ncbi:methylated-DNA--[protein]-cysteine S-methyltransferase [Denitrobaculum tricleocarpae]|uniref:Methylated-DNA--protein-cysteine methyltransferase n=1 Tax=Denitrobaculum tricleocarpae TaxID=2591009 RepID=A0A545TAS4_9PROT|nr:methylated-DNA--[protein]-cysteine S-methyltransferase [Denitrobaculum tricleocarpae]TQV74311.1 methylated-DNA--[protein]-cysteine S-methyltransferase [Denitrobaculum tricleocarpae]